MSEKKLSDFTEDEIISEAKRIMCSKLDKYAFDYIKNSNTFKNNPSITRGILNTSGDDISSEMQAYHAVLINEHLDFDENIENALKIMDEAFLQLSKFLPENEKGNLQNH